MKQGVYLTNWMMEKLDQLRSEGKITDSDYADLVDGIADCVDHALYRRADEPLVKAIAEAV